MVVVTGLWEPLWGVGQLGCFVGLKVKFYLIGNAFGVTVVGGLLIGTFIFSITVRDLWKKSNLW